MPAEIECPNCGGEGAFYYEAYDDYEGCTPCDGTGWIPASELRERGEGG